MQGGLQEYIAHYDSILINWPGLAIDFGLLQKTSGEFNIPPLLISLIRRGALISLFVYSQKDESAR